MDKESRHHTRRRGHDACTQSVPTKSAIALLFVLGITALLLSGCTDGAEDGKEPEVVARSPDEVLEYRAVTSFPDYVPTVDTHHDTFLNTPRKIDPRVIYVRYHRLGWEDCLLLFGEEGIQVETQEAAGAHFHVAGVAGKYVFLGLEDGFDACKRRIAELRNEYPEGELRGLALKAFDRMTKSTDEDTGEEDRRSVQVIIRDVRLSETDR